MKTRRTNTITITGKAYFLNFRNIRKKMLEIDLIKPVRKFNKKINTFLKKNPPLA